MWLKGRAMNRRAFVTGLGVLLTAPLAVEALAEQPAKVYKLGYLMFGSLAASTNRIDALRIGLRTSGMWRAGTSPSHSDRQKQSIG
jgi:hypothetical protein